MTYNEMMRSLGTEESTFMKSISSDRFNKPHLINMILGIISDDNIKKIDNTRAHKLFKLMHEYYKAAFTLFIDADVSRRDKLDKLIEYSTSIVYYTNTFDYCRVATVNEVKNGIAELVKNESRNIDEEVEENLWLLLWTFYGKLSYYKKAGLTYSYTDGKLDDTPIQLIFRAGQKLRRLVDWLNIGGEYDRTIEILKHVKKAGAYKYPTFAQDEITCDRTPKQIMFLCKNNIIGRGATDIQKEVKRIIFILEKNNQEPLPHEIALMRIAYNEIESGITHSKDEKLLPEIDELCTKLELASKSGLIDKSHFAFKVIETVRKTLKCSEKQLAWLRRAESEIRVGDGDPDELLDNTSNEEELINIHDMLGSGALGV